ncbi:MAG: Bax inhibitor-1/YccA family protein, partial [Alphaproteobacteria bacterium]|nr:Bax inhibitor-1/YccA family protein [Alphaproteobacteria bacterium]
KISKRNDGMSLYLKRVFALMFGAVGITAITSYITLSSNSLFWSLFSINGGMTGLYYVLLFGGLALSIWAQARAFHMKPVTAGLLLALYSITMGVVLTPLLLVSIMHNPWVILFAFIISAIMFACMALFGYKTAKDLSFLRLFLFMGMIGLILVGIASFFWSNLLGGAFGTIVCLIGVLVFALFTAYDMQTLKSAYNYVGDETQKNQLAVLGALHMYISFIAMFQYILSLFNRD